MDFIQRIQLIDRIQKAFQVNRIVCLLGPRQCGKTTLARRLWNENKKTRNDPGYFDLERPSDLQALNNPDLVLPHIQGLIVIDEIQRLPNLFSYLRYLHDEHLNQQFLILGSASKELIHQSSESLAGRISYIDITPFSLSEIDNWNDLWLKGGFPKSYLLDSEQSLMWRENYMRTYVEQDLAMFGFGFQTDVLQKLWFMLAHYHGQIINYSELGASLNVSQPTIKKYISYLTGSFMLRLLKPWHENLQKRQVKSPKIYYRDSGLLHYVLGIHDYENIFKHPKAGSSFEGFAMEEIIKYHAVPQDSCYFWGSHNQAELDLLILKNGKKLGFEFKMTDAPKLTPSMRIALEDLKLDSLTVVYPGTRTYQLAENVYAVPLMSYKVKGDQMMTDLIREWIAKQPFGSVLCPSEYVNEYWGISDISYGNVLGEFDAISKSNGEKWAMDSKFAVSKSKDEKWVICELTVAGLYYKGDVSKPLIGKLAELVGSNDPKILSTEQARVALRDYASKKEEASKETQSKLTEIKKIKDKIAQKLAPQG